MTEPKVVVSEHRSTAIVAQQKFEMGATIFRNVPGASRGTLTKFGADTDVPEDKVLIMSMVSPTAASGYYAKTELGKTYTPPATGFSAGYLSDVLRMETFGKNATDGLLIPMDADVSFDVYLGPVDAPELLRVAKIAPDGTLSLVATAPTDHSMDTQSLSVSVAEFPGDFMVLLADDPCATASPCDAKAICTNVKKGVLDELEASSSAARPTSAAASRATARSIRISCRTTSRTPRAWTTTCASRMRTCSTSAGASRRSSSTRMRSARRSSASPASARTSRPRTGSPRALAPRRTRPTRRSPRIRRCTAARSARRTTR